MSYGDPLPREVVEDEIVILMIKTTDEFLEAYEHDDWHVVTVNPHVAKRRLYNPTLSLWVDIVVVQQSERHRVEVIAGSADNRYRHHKGRRVGHVLKEPKWLREMIDEGIHEINKILHPLSA